VPTFLWLSHRAGAWRNRDRDQLRANVLRDWSIIKFTRSMNLEIDSLALLGHSATVYTSQRWDRLMFERDGRILDTVVPTERDRETWRQTPMGWRAFGVVELGGTITVNGKTFTP
jgi:hypothetical protein